MMLGLRGAAGVSPAAEVSQRGSNIAAAPSPIPLQKSRRFIADPFLGGCATYRLTPAAGRLLL